MRITNKGYYDRSEISNSMLGVYKNSLSGSRIRMNKDALLLGNVVDSIITGSQMPAHVKSDILIQSLEMAQSFLSDSFNSFVVDNWEKQAAFIDNISFGFNGYIYHVHGRCLADFYDPQNGFLGDLKTTNQTTDKGWLSSINTFSYYRQAAWYMDITGCNSFTLMAVSKTKPYKLFRTIIRRGDALYNKGVSEYSNILGCLKMAYDGDEAMANLLL